VEQSRPLSPRRTPPRSLAAGSGPARHHPSLPRAETAASCRHPTLALGGKAPRGPEGWIAKGDTFALDPAAEQIPAVAHPPLPTWLPHKEWA